MSKEHRSRGPSGRILMWAGIAILLLTPAIAMQVTDEVQWTGLDFALAGALLVGSALAYELAARRVEGRGPRALVAGGIAVIVAIVWAQGAVGIL